MMADDIERRVGNLERRQDVQDAKFEAFIRSMEDFKAEMRDFKTEMRQQNEMRAREIAELRQESDRKIDQLSAEIKDVGKEVRNLFWTGAIGIGALFLTVVYTIIKGG